MGQAQSSGSDNSTGSGNARFHSQGEDSMASKNYYELLGIDPQASESEIKQAYRKKALELHPDRNFGNIEETTKLFAEVQMAYEVLSDPQERAWYDSHKGNPLEWGTFEPGSGINQIGTTTEAVTALHQSLYGIQDFSDGPSAFFTVLRDFFDQVAREENMFGELSAYESKDYPTFGASADPFTVVVKPFYDAWTGFKTVKEFRWREIYRYSEAPDRRTRRMMEKENRRLRDEGINEFNESVRSLVAIVRKRDPRRIAFLQASSRDPSKQRAAAARQAAKSRAAFEAKMDAAYSVPQWVSAPGEGLASSSEEVGEEEENKGAKGVEVSSECIECVACGKSFKSENQYRAHEKSKKHLREVKHLKKQLQKDDPGLDLGSDNGSDRRGDQSKDEACEKKGQDGIEIKEAIISSLGEEETLPQERRYYDIHANSDLSNSSRGLRRISSDLVSSDEIFRNAEDGQSSVCSEDQEQQNLSDLTRRSEEGKIKALKKTETTEKVTVANLGKAKQKRARQAAKTAKTDTEQNGIKCNVCRASFSSKTQLFNHIRKLDHAAAQQ